MRQEQRLNACRNQFVYERFLEDYYANLKKLYANMNFIHAISEVSQNTTEILLYGIDADNDASKKEAFRKFKDDFCDIFFKSLKFSDYPEYEKIYYSIKEKGYSGKSATISVFYAMIYFDILKEDSKEELKAEKSFFDKLFTTTNRTEEKNYIKKNRYSNSELRRGFKAFLIELGYKEYTPSGHPSTVYQYIDAIGKVCEQECFDWVGIADNIEIIVQKYNWGGEKESFGNKGHRTVINAILRYSEFLKRKY